jgi:hypothetical protein
MCGIPGDSLDFNPVGFAASTAGAGGVDITDGNLAFMVQAKPGFAISNMKFDEGGDTTMAGLGIGTFTSVTLDGIINVQEVDGMGINSIQVPITMTFSPTGGFYSLAGGPVFHTLWTGTLLVDLTTGNPIIAAGLAAQGKVPVLGVTKVSVDFDNTLVAISEAGTSALIAKKDFIGKPGMTVSSNIPEPASCALALFGLVAGVLFPRRPGR